MALIKCPKCGKEFSDRALACPQCGATKQEIERLLDEQKDAETAERIAKEAEEERIRVEKRAKWWAANKRKVEIVICCLIASLLFCGYVVYVNFTPIVARDKSEIEMASNNPLRFLTNKYKVNIPDGTREIGFASFQDCSCILSVRIPDGVVYIGQAAFDKCINMKSIYIPNGVKSIEYGAFEKCIKLKNITIPSSITYIGANAFSECSSLTSVSMPEGVIGIEPGTFAHCTSLTSIEIPSSVTYIGFAAFYHCSNLTSITIPNSVTFIESDAFEYCRKLVIKIPARFEGNVNLKLCKQVIYY